VLAGDSARWSVTGERERDAVERKRERERRAKGGWSGSLVPDSGLPLPLFILFSLFFCFGLS